NVGAGAERVEQRGVLGDVRENAKLDLRVVGGDQDPVGRPRDECAADPAAQRRADRDVLEIRSAAREPASRRDGLVERGVYAPGLRIDQSTEALRVRRTKLFDLAVLENLLDNRVHAAKLLEDRGVGGKTRPRPAAAGELQLLEQERLELLRGVQTELVTDRGERLLLDPRDLPREFLAEGTEVCGV